MLTSRDIRQQFIDYFVDKCGHTFAPSSPVVPHDDPTLLFTNAGMNQFKPYFLGTEQPPYPRAANTQKCIRAGGKHNDLEDVGKDTYHHTFFEMLGNWSFGDYFKAEAIEWAWDLLTNVWKIDPERLHATYFEGDASEGLAPDDEARELWLRYLPAERVHPGNKKDNFWEMGDTGPCGPCSELHYDRTPDKNGANLVNADAQDDVVEIWNLVFIQFNRGNDGKLSPLPAQHVDTGMGFERIVRVLQGKDSNYDTDVFTPIFEAIANVTGARAYTGKLDDHIDTAYRVLADHMRCLTFALTDGAVPSNEGRGYVLRRILRRAVRHGWQTLNMHEPFLHKLVAPVANHMGEAFPELKKNPQRVADLIKEEEESFGRTLDRGIALFEQAAVTAIWLSIPDADLLAGPGGNEPLEVGSEYLTNPRGSGTANVRKSDGTIEQIKIPLDADGQRALIHQRGLSVTIQSSDAFKLHDTYGFPLDLTQVMAEERAINVDVAGFNRLMEAAREQARAGGDKADVGASLVEIVQNNKLPKTEFVGYDTTELTDATVLGAFDVGNNELAVVTDRTPFYGESGGQVGDVGSLGNLTVIDTQKVGDVVFHLCEGEDKPSGSVTLAVDTDRRAKIMANHTTTHVMNRALRKHVSATADQKGSLVDDEKLRFDFSHNAALTPDEIEQVEQMVNADITADIPVYWDYAPLAEAQKINGLRAVFGEKYPATVRIVSIGVEPKQLIADPDNAEWPGHSIEFCGGTHLTTTGDAEGFCITHEEAVAKGVRRITALTGQRAHQAAAQGDMLQARLDALQSADEQSLATQLAELTNAINAAPLPALARQRLQAGIASLQKKQREFEKQRNRAAAGDVVETARQIADSADDTLVVAEVPGADGKTLRDAMDVIRKRKPDAALLLGAAADGKCAFLAAVPKPMIAQGLKAGDWVREVAKVAGGGGGGRPDMAQAGGKDPEKLTEALDAGRTFAQSKL